MSEATVETQPTSPTLHSRTNDNDGPLNPALSEPDAMAIAQRSAATLAPSVSLARKKDLLVKARKERRKWIQLVPLPYTNLRDPDNIWSFDDRLHQVQTSLACKRITSATKVLSELYGLENNIRNPEAVAERVDALVSFLGSVLTLYFCCCLCIEMTYTLTNTCLRRSNHSLRMIRYSMMLLKF